MDISESGAIVECALWMTLLWCWTAGRSIGKGIPHTFLSWSQFNRRSLLTFIDCVSLRCSSPPEDQSWCSITRPLFYSSEKNFNSAARVNRLMWLANSPHHPPAFLDQLLQWFQQECNAMSHTVCYMLLWIWNENLIPSTIAFNATSNICISLYTHWFFNEIIKRKVNR